VVGATGRRVSRAVHLSCLRDVGGIPERPLQLRTVSLTVLLSRDFRRIAAQLVWSKASGIAGMASFFPPLPHSSPSRLLSPDLLLLPRCLLQGLLGRSSVVHGRGAALAICGRALVSAHPAEFPSLHAVHLGGRVNHPLHGRLGRVLVSQSRY